MGKWKCLLFILLIWLCFWRQSSVQDPVCSHSLPDSILIRSEQQLYSVSAPAHLSVFYPLCLQKVQSRKGNHFCCIITLIKKKQKHLSHVPCCEELRCETSLAAACFKRALLSFIMVTTMYFYKKRGWCYTLKNNTRVVNRQTDRFTTVLPHSRSITTAVHLLTGNASFPDKFSKFTNLFVFTEITAGFPVYW